MTRPNEEADRLTPADVARYALCLLGGSVNRAVAGMPALRSIAENRSTWRGSDLAEALAALDEGDPAPGVRPPPKAPRRRGWVYVTTAGPRVKIGFSTDVRRRMIQLGAQTPYELLLVSATPGTVDDEAEMHRRFAACRVHGEWFEPDAEMRAWLDGLA